MLFNLCFEVKNNRFCISVRKAVIGTSTCIFNKRTAVEAYEVCKMFFEYAPWIKRIASEWALEDFKRN